MVTSGRVVGAIVPRSAECMWLESATVKAICLSAMVNAVGSSEDDTVYKRLTNEIWQESTRENEGDGDCEPGAITTLSRIRTYRPTGTR